METMEATTIILTIISTLGAGIMLIGGFCTWMHMLNLSCIRTITPVGWLIEYYDTYSQFHDALQAASYRWATYFRKAFTNQWQYYVFCYEDRLNWFGMLCLTPILLLSMIGFFIEYAVGLLVSYALLLVILLVRIVLPKTWKFLFLKRNRD